MKLSRGLSSDQYVEKGLLYLLLFSLFLHVAGFVIWYKWPKDENKVPEATFIDLQDMPQLKPQQPQKEQEKALPSDRRQRVAKQMAPRGEMQINRPAANRPASKPAPKVARPSPAPSQPSPSSSATVSQQQAKPSKKPSQSLPDETSTSASELIRRSKPQPQAKSGAGGSGSAIDTRFMPSASRMAKLEENYRRRFADDIAEGDTRFLNTNDVLFGSFLKRFENAIYGVWRYPQEAAMNGIEGVTPVKIVFNRDGSINFAKTKLLESSGSKVLDDEVMRTLRAVGPLGNFPKDYQKEEFNLIGFFQYGSARRRLR